MWARRDSSPLRQRSSPSSTPATSCSLLKVGGVCEVSVICASRGGGAASCNLVRTVLLNRVVPYGPTPDATPLWDDVVRRGLVGPAPRSDPRRNTPCGGDVMLRGPCRTES